MKYKARQMSNGNWAVFSSGVKYFIGTERKTEAEAQKQACIRSAEWHQIQMDKCQTSWEKLRETDGEPNGWQDWGDTMA